MSQQGLLSSLPKLSNPIHIDKRTNSDCQKSVPVLLYVPSVTADRRSSSMSSRKRQGCCTMNARTVLWFLTFAGFAINYMIRINMNITIVDMILPATKTILINNKTTTRLEPECYVRIPVNQSLFLHSSDMDNTSEAVAVAWRNETQRQRYSFERVLLDWLKVSLLQINRYVYIILFGFVSTGRLRSSRL